MSCQDPDPSWFYRTCMDAGAFGFGLLASPEKLRLDMPENAMLLDALESAAIPDRSVPVVPSPLPKDRPLDWTLKHSGVIRSEIGPTSIDTRKPVTAADGDAVHGAPEGHGCWKAIEAGAATRCGSTALTSSRTMTPSAICAR